MNTETGEIKEFKEGEKIPENFVEVSRKDMTNKQKESMQVSKYDSISKLGKLFYGNRKERRRQAKLFKSKKENFK
jgi:hypothetical protein